MDGNIRYAERRHIFHMTYLLVLPLQSLHRWYLDNTFLGQWCNPSYLRSSFATGRLFRVAIDRGTVLRLSTILARLQIKCNWGAPMIESWWRNQEFVRAASIPHWKQSNRVSAGKGSLSSTLEVKFNATLLDLLSQFLYFFLFLPTRRALHVLALEWIACASGSLKSWKFAWDPIFRPDEIFGPKLLSILIRAELFLGFFVFGGPVCVTSSSL